MSISNYLETVLLDLVFNATAYSGQSTAYMQLHIGDPGEAGTANVAAETTRKAVTFGAAASGAISNDAQIQWTNVAGTEDYTHFSLWDASTNGNCLWVGTVTANAVTAGDTFTVAVGDLDLTLD